MGSCVGKKENHDLSKQPSANEDIRGINYNNNASAKASGVTVVNKDYSGQSPYDTSDDEHVKTTESA